METNSEADAKVRAQYEGKLKFPTVMAGDNFIKNPTIPQLIKFLRKHKII